MAINNAVLIAKSHNKPLVIVVSAIGKTTTALEQLWKAYINQDIKTIDVLLSEIYAFHHTILLDLKEDLHGMKGFLESFAQLKNHLQNPPTENSAFEYDQIVPYGELWSTIIVEQEIRRSGMNSQWMDARKLIRTSDHFQEGRVDWAITCGLVKQELGRGFSQGAECIITQGFIGHTSSGVTTTLGREGSDFTAAILGWALDAEEVLIWKDVPGLLNADPKKFEYTVKIDQISYREAIELSYFGASIIHPKTLKPLQNKNIPLKIKSFVDPEAKGTMIHSEERFDDNQSSYILTNNQMLMTISPTDFSFIMEDHISVIFNVFAKHGVKVHLMQNSALNFSVCANVKPCTCVGLITELSKSFLVRYNENVDLFTVRHYQTLDLPEQLQHKTILLQQRSRSTLRYVLR